VVRIAKRSFAADVPKQSLGTRETDWSDQMNTLTAENSQAFLERFSEGHDGVIRALAITFRYHLRKETIGAVTISLRDSQTQENGGWVNLVIEMEGVAEFVFREGRVSYQVICPEIHIGRFEGLLFIDFGGCTEQPEDANGFRSSEFYFASRSVRWRIEPYQENSP
jgi:hypothetical protein